VKREIEILIGGDKPWILEFIGKMNMNSTYPFSFCTCNQEQGKDFTQHPKDHDFVDADRACRLAHVSPEWRWLGQEWVDFQCEIPNCTLGENSSRLVTQASYDALMGRLASLDAKEHANEVKRIAKQHFCFKPGKVCPIRYFAILPDPMHAISNILTPITRACIWQPLTYEPDNVRADIRALKDLAIDMLNKENRRHGVQAVFHNDEQGMPKFSGNVCKDIMSSGILYSWIRIVSPVLRLALPRKTALPPPAAPQEQQGAAKRRGRKSAVDMLQAAVVEADRVSSSRMQSEPRPAASITDEEYLNELQKKVEIDK